MKRNWGSGFLALASIVLGVVIFVVVRVVEKR